MFSLEILLYIVLAYLTGAIPFAVWIGKFFCGIDLREFGSNNSGATNAFRVLGAKVGSAVLFLDVFKAWISVNYIYFISDSSLKNQYEIEFQLILGLAAVIGHVFPVYVGFRGGKGIATLLGLLIAIHFSAAIFSLFIFVLILMIFRYVSLASIFASISFPIYLLFFSQNIDFSLIIFAIIVPILSLITHKKNIVRLINKEETKVNFGIK